MSINDLSQLGTLSFNQGMLGFKLSKKGGEYRIGDRLLFYPSISIDKYSVSDTKERFFKHIFYDIYEFTFIAIDKYEHDSEEYKDRYHYLIEIIPGFNVFHFNWPKKADEYLQMNTLYRGFGRLSNCENPALYNPEIDPKAMNRIRCEGILERLQINGIWRDNREYITPTTENIGDAFSYDDVLKSIGYPGDMIKFRSKITKYQNDQTSLKSTADASNMLVYTIKMA